MLIRKDPEVFCFITQLAVIQSLNEATNTPNCTVRPVRGQGRSYLVSQAFGKEHGV